MLWYVLEMVSMDWGGALDKQYVQVSMHGINCMGLMALFWLVVVYYELNEMEDGSDVQ
jgi:hypothetical protein